MLSPNLGCEFVDKPLVHLLYVLSLFRYFSGVFVVTSEDQLGESPVKVDISAKSVQIHLDEDSCKKDGSISTKKI